MKFSYRAKNRQGQTIKGQVEARGQKEAVLLLREKDLLVFDIKEVRGADVKKTFTHFFGRVGLGDLATFTRQLSTMITAGLALPEALDTLRGQAKPAMSLIIEDILHSIEAGTSFSAALKKHEGSFGRVYIALITAGEAAGVLDEVLARLADNLEKEREFRGKIKGAMIYPAIIILGMGGVGLVFMVVVLPQIMNLFVEFNVALPLPTKILIAVSGFFKNFWWLIGPLIGGLFFVWRSINRTRAGKERVDKFKLKLPIFGNLTKQVTLTETVRTLALLVKTGIPLVGALNIISEGMENLVYRDGLRSAAAKVEKGFPLAVALAENENFPSILTQMIAVGEETGKLDEVLFKVAHYFETGAEDAVRGLTTAIEPLIMIVLGLGVGFLVAAVIMPMYQLTTQF